LPQLFPVEDKGTLIKSQKADVPEHGRKPNGRSENGVLPRSMPAMKPSDPMAAGN